MSKSKRKPPFVELVWRDAATYSEERSAAQVATDCVLIEQHTLGYVAYEDSERIAVAQTFSPDNEGEVGYDEITVVPKPWIIRRLRGRKKKR